MEYDYKLDNWLILEVNIDGLHHRVIGGGSGGYLDPDWYRMNSGIDRIEKDNNYYYIHGTSGSLYKVPIEREQIANSFAEVILNLEETYPDTIRIVPMHSILNSYMEQEDE